MGHADGTQDIGEAGSYFAPFSGLWVGLLAFAGVYGATIAVALYEGRWSFTLPGGTLAYPVLLVENAFWYFNNAHVGAAVQPLILLVPGSLERIPGVLVYLVPPVILTAAGGFLVHRSDASGSRGAYFVRGASVAAGYFPGVFLIHLYLYVRQPYPLAPAVRPFVVVGVAYPIVFGGIGGVIARRAGGRRSAEPTSRDGESEAPTAADERGQQEVAGESTAASKEPSDKTTYFKEALTPRVSGGVLTLLFGFFLLFTVPILALLLLIPAPGADVNWRAGLIALAGFGFFGALWGAGVYYRMRVYVEVTDSGVEVVRNWNTSRGAPGVRVPFKDISRVQTTESIRSHVDEQEYGDSPRQTYMVTTGRLPGVDLSYHEGVRVERKDAPPVYIGSEQPDELASAIRTGVPSGEQAAAETPEPTESVAGASRGAGAGVGETAGSDEISGSVPGASEKQERRMVISVIVIAVGGILVFSLFGKAAVFPVCGALGAFFLYGGVNGWRAEQHELTTFEKTTGTVLETEVETVPDSRRKPLVKYGYTVDGHRYENDKIWPGKPMAKQMSPRGSQDFLSRFPEGEETTVYYDPEEPSNAFLVRESTKGWMALIAVVGVGLLMYASMGFLGVIQPPA